MRVVGAVSSDSNQGMPSGVPLQRHSEVRIQPLLARGRSPRLKRFGVPRPGRRRSSDARIRTVIPRLRHYRNAA